MTRVAVLLVLLAIFSVDAEDKSMRYRQPTCGVLSFIQGCPLNYSPVCGSDGITYVNECTLCAHRMKTNTDILIIKDEAC